MKKFNKLFSVEKTKVRVAGEYGFRNIKEIHEGRKWIKVEGLKGSFQRDDIITFTNKVTVEMYPAIEDLYYWDQCGSVFERTSSGKKFIGKLNGRTIKEFLRDQRRLRIKRLLSKNMQASSGGFY